MQISRKYSTKTQIKIGLAAAAIAIVWSFSGYMWFKQSENWSEIKKLIVSHPTIIHEVGEVNNVSLSYLGTSYKFSGEWGEANLEVDIQGNNSHKKYELTTERNRGVWSIKNISSR